ncbi:hypothetical protein METBIDRAFT_33774 [Metschnikowia bicuspidata var. bicuspidata NRRL YB-4993]|uniref:Palmitoyltransferase n=1 Tax=Metschnikowia bicuspidata var. bicuspidata NRRL YB-4993 TaxID=869754 RepID=A0A1A0H244_9ASCO|nr:hypothetical protein METBIDRAFT_33774 [Metschnikowia bicuspidata var. bicuspidata NRRL YB-4993]OBA18025.1 hypothetical protein METBIDRAFT_33774 [Metschnikowia bicuspidata var. bicuspidata NRRL YB-4993]
MEERAALNSLSDEVAADSRAAVPTGSNIMGSVESDMPDLRKALTTVEPGAANTKLEKDTKSDVLNSPGNTQIGIRESGATDSGGLDTQSHNHGSEDRRKSEEETGPFQENNASDSKAKEDALFTPASPAVLVGSKDWGLENAEGPTEQAFLVQGEAQKQAPGGDCEPLQEPSEEEANPVLAQYMAACQNGDLAVVTDLISLGKVRAQDTFSEGVTGLHWAAINNRLQVVKFLVENPYSRSDPNALGGTLAASPLHWACRNGLVYVVDYFLSHTNADPTLTDSQKYNVLHLAVHSSNIMLVVYILLKCVMIDKSIYIDEPENIQCTALHWAAYQGDILTVNALLKYGADVLKIDQSQMTPLHWAFMRGYKSVLATLLDAGSDIFYVNDKNRDSFGVAEDMNCGATWSQILKEADRNPKKEWALNTHAVSPKTAKIVTFLTPYMTLPLVFHMCSFNAGYAIPKLFFSALVFAASIFFLLKLVIPVYLRKDKALFQTPYLAGLFSATATWAIVTWFFVELPKLWLRSFFTNVVFTMASAAFIYCFFKAMTINPGVVPVPSDPRVIFNDIKELVSLGHFDTEHFCVNTFTRRPLRSKYSHTSNTLVARFDHYCPWVYNDIGVRNHKLFITFVYCLSAAVVLFSVLTVEYFEVYAEEAGYTSDFEDSCLFLSEEMCVAYMNKPFIFNLMIWCWMQGIWIAFLCVVQTFQIGKGLTTWEFSSLDKRMSNPAFNHSTVPGDFQGPNGAQSNAGNSANHGHKHQSGLGTCMKLLGIDQFTMALRAGLLLLLKKSTHTDSYTSIESFDIPTDFGWKQNWLDFWFIGDIKWRNVFFLPIEGENNLNGQVVDYYKLYEFPPKATGAQAV